MPGVELQVLEAHEVGRGAVHEVEVAADGAHRASIAHAVGDRAVLEEDGLAGLLREGHRDGVDPFARDVEAAAARSGIRILLHRDEDGARGLVGRHLEPAAFGGDCLPFDVYGRYGNRPALLSAAEVELRPVGGQLRHYAVLHHLDRYRLGTARDGDPAAARLQVVPRAYGHLDRAGCDVGGHVDPGIALLDFPVRPLRIHGQRQRSSVGFEEEPVGRREGDLDGFRNENRLFCGVAARNRTESQEQKGQSDE